LDLNTPDALRITSCADEETTDGINDCLQAYFCEKGAYVAVVEETVSIADFAEYIGLETTDSMGILTEGIEALTAPYFTRYAESQADGNLEELYYEQVEKTELEEIFVQALRKNFDRLEKYVADVQTLAELEERIRNHSDNPLRRLVSFLPCDYWKLKSAGKEEEYTSDFKACMQEMEGLLQEYEAEYGTLILNSLDFQRMVEECNALPLDMLKGLIDDFNAELFSQLLKDNSTSLAKLLKNIGEDISQISQFYEAPADWEDYGAKMQKYVNSRYKMLEAQGKGVYEQSREALSKDDYEAHIKGILEEYGSLQGYWESLQK